MDPKLMQLIRKNLSGSYYNDKELKLEYIPTGFLSVDAALGGGMPHPIICLISGETNTGKTLLMSTIASSIAESGDWCIYVALEGRTPHSLKSLFSTLGSNQENIVLVSYSKDHPTAVEVIGAVLGLLKATPNTPPKAVFLDSINHSLFIAEPTDVGAEFAAKRAMTIKNMMQSIIPYCQKHGMSLYSSTHLHVDIAKAGAARPGFIPMRETGGVFPLQSAVLILRTKMKREDSDDGITLTQTLEVTKSQLPEIVERSKIQITLQRAENLLAYDPTLDMIEMGFRFGVFTKEDGSPSDKRGNIYYNRNKIGVGGKSVEEWIHNINEEQYRALYEEIKERAKNEFKPGEVLLDADSVSDVFENE